MQLSFLLFLISLYFLQIDAHSLLKTYIASIHGGCLSLLPSSSSPEIYEALVCGKRLDDNDLRHTLASTGLMHIFVVSGMHLSGIHKVLSKIKVPFSLQVILLAFYALATALNPPVVRAWFSLCLRFIKEKFALQWDQTISVWHVSLTALLFFAPWYDSFSFLLSWAASLALALGKNQTLLTKNIIVYVIMAPLLGSISNPHPMSILINTVFLPLFGTIFFPLILLSVVFPPLTFVGDHLWFFLLQCLETLAGEIPLFKPTFYLHTEHGIFYLLFLHFSIFIHTLIVRQGLIQRRTL